MASYIPHNVFYTWEAYAISSSVSNCGTDSIAILWTPQYGVLLIVEKENRARDSMKEL